jgi:MFS transporter, putative metabolite:H+ symporter
MMETDMHHTAAQRLDRLPTSAFHRRLAVLIGLGLFFDAFDLYMAGGVMVALTLSGWATMATNASFVSAGALGALLGAFFAGWCGDRFGRRFTFQFNLLLFGAMSVAAAFAPSMNWLIVLRFVMGIGLGAEIVVGYATISEFVPPATRGKWNAVLFFLSTAALPVSTAASYLIIPHFGWRAMFGLSGLGALAVWVLRKKLPESPRWLELAGRHEEAEAIVARIESVVERESGCALPPVEAVPAAAAPAAPAAMRRRTSELFRPPLLASTFVGVTLNVVGLVGVYGFVIWLPTFLVRSGMSMHASLGFSSLMALGSLAGVALAGRYSDRIGRRRGVIVASLLSAALGVVYAHAGSSLATMAVGVLLTTAMYFCGTLGFSAYVPELFPTALRLRGCSVASVAGRAASIVAPQLVALLYARGGGVTGVTVALAALVIFQALVVAAFGKNTTRVSLDRLFDETPGYGEHRDEAPSHNLVVAPLADDARFEGS